jgi:hypothetical protein
MICARASVARLISPKSGAMRPGRLPSAEMNTRSRAMYLPTLARSPKSLAYCAVELEALPRPMNFVARSAFA